MVVQASESQSCSENVALQATVVWWRESPTLSLPLCCPKLFLTQDVSLWRCLVWNDCHSRHCQAGGSPCCAHAEKHGNRRGADNRRQQKNCKSHCYSGTFLCLKKMCDGLPRICLFQWVGSKQSFPGCVKERLTSVELDWKSGGVVWHGKVQWLH